MNVFETCFLYASNGNQNKTIRSVNDEKILFMYKVITEYDSSIEQNVCILMITVFEESETLIFAFGISEQYPDIGISIMKVQGNKTLHCSDVSTVEDLEARLFQLETVVDVYDLDTSLLDKMNIIREVFLNKKDETVLNNLV
ncbi:hypothetical protein pEaSNUABM47_00482 [Erwinia phage pEa_SNUABM_47]|uniref:Uncharacterized protein n=1 Tax=Erwinia phage pEa_SNUABM_47 TaxID=2768774 RepID=A0A7L8ZNA4_9CAUD|nr:hypothetical protein pEaSNUABM47_00482 [Erwinia phage pEa_SNUABM_47]QXO12713.1 hypothetical protein pEaSNUABM49_00489 [Erwinia phage pEa_SNUABM_49]